MTNTYLSSGGNVVGISSTIPPTRNRIIARNIWQALIPTILSTAAIAITVVIVLQVQQPQRTPAYWAFAISMLIWLSLAVVGHIYDTKANHEEGGYRN